MCRVSLLLVPLGLGDESIFFYSETLGASRSKMGGGPLARFFFDEAEIFIEGARLNWVNE